MLKIEVNNKIPPFVAVSGEVDFSNSARLQQTLDELTCRGHCTICLDLSEVSFIDSGGIAVLLRCLRILREQNGEMKIVGCSRQVRQTLFDCGMIGIFEATDTAFLRGNTEAGWTDDRERWLVTSFTVPINPMLPSVIRERIGKLIADLPLTEIERTDVKLAVGEATSNAIKYGCRDGNGSVSVHCVADSRELMIEIKDSGPGFDCAAVCPPDFESLPTGGMGIAIMQLTMDDVKFEFESGTTVRMIKRLQTQRAF